MIAVWMSHLPIETAHCNDPINDLYFSIPFSSRNSEVSSSGWSPFSSGDRTLLSGHSLNIRSYAATIFSMCFAGFMHKVPSLSRSNPHPRWKLTGPDPFNSNS